MQPWARSFYRSRAWQECRAALVADRYGLCEQCGGPGLIVHHRVRLTPANIGNPAVTLDWANLELLCIECHNRAHGGDSVSDGLSFDASGNLIRRPLDIRIVWGSPASGKSRYVEEHRGPLDLVVDLDTLRAAISPGTAKGSDHLLGVAIAMRDLLYDRIARRQVECRIAWVIACLPEREERRALAARLGTDQLILMDTSREECERRAMADDERPDKRRQMAIIAEWWARYQPE